MIQIFIFQPVPARDVVWKVCYRLLRHPGVPPLRLVLYDGVPGRHDRRCVDLHRVTVPCDPGQVHLAEDGHVDLGLGCDARHDLPRPLLLQPHQQHLGAQGLRLAADHLRGLLHHGLQHGTHRAPLHLHLGILLSTGLLKT